MPDNALQFINKLRADVSNYPVTSFLANPAAAAAAAALKDSQTFDKDQDSASSSQFPRFHNPLPPLDPTFMQDPFLPFPQIRPVATDTLMGGSASLPHGLPQPARV